MNTKNNGKVQNDNWHTVGYGESIIGTLKPMGIQLKVWVLIIGFVQIFWGFDHYILVGIICRRIVLRCLLDLMY